MTKILAKNSINPQNMLQYIIKEDKRDIQFFFIEYTKTGLQILTQGITIHRLITTIHPTWEENWSLQDCEIWYGERGCEHTIQSLLAPGLLLICY